MTADRTHNQARYEAAPPVRADRFSHTGQGQAFRALGLPKEALRAPVQAGPRAALTRYGGASYPAPEGDAVAGRGERQAALPASPRLLVGAAQGGDRLGGTVRPPGRRWVRLRGLAQLLLLCRLKGRAHVGRVIAPHRVDDPQPD